MNKKSYGRKSSYLFLISSFSITNWSVHESIKKFNVVWTLESLLLKFVLICVSTSLIIITQPWLQWIICYIYSQMLYKIPNPFSYSLVTVISMKFYRIIFENQSQLDFCSYSSHQQYIGCNLAVAEYSQKQCTVIGCISNHSTAFW